jgi:hypothetical protein
MAQILSILALSTKAMTERWMSESQLIHALPSLAKYGPEKFLKRLIGKSGVEDALLRLDSLTKEESLMVVAKNLEVAHRVKELAEDIDDKMQVIGRVDQNVVAVKERTQWFLTLFLHVLNPFPIASQIGADEQERLLFVGSTSIGHPS